MAQLSADLQTVQDEIEDLERRLKDAKSRLKTGTHGPSLPPAAVSKDRGSSKQGDGDGAGNGDNVPALHALLLLSDSALPLGSFAFSSGLESYLAHHKPSRPTASQLTAFHTFLDLSLSTLASTALPYVLAGYRNPEDIETLDNDMDASTPCPVARRASTAQGRALLAVWQRSFRPQYEKAHSATGSAHVAVQALNSFSGAIRTSQHLNAHLAPLWGLVTSILAVPLHDAAYLFVFSHARTVISAAVRASVMGPYQAQAVLASVDLQNRIRGLIRQEWDTAVQDAAQSVPVMDLWVGRHEKLYSRIFNS